MRNIDKYKTAHERAEAFMIFCGGGQCGKFQFQGDHYINKERCRFLWLDLECEDEKPLPCPFCGKDCNVIEFHTPIGFRYKIGCIECAYSSMQYKTQDDAIAAHNRVSKKCREGME